MQLPGSEDAISSVGFASEKLGVKFRLRKFDDFVGFDNVVKNDLNLNKKNPFVNEIYAIAYGSGLLYSLADTTTKKNFDYPHVGFGAGLRFFNSLDFNISMGIPFIDGKPFSLHDRFLSIGLDIPLSEYLEKIAKK